MVGTGYGRGDAQGWDTGDWDAGDGDWDTGADPWYQDTHARQPAPGAWQAQPGETSSPPAGRSGAGRSGAGRSDAGRTGGRSVALVVGGLVAVVGLAVAAFVAVYMTAGGSGETSGVSADAGAGSGSGSDPGWTTGAGAGAPVADPGAVLSDDEGGTSLDRLVSESSAVLEQVEGRWVPQLAAMRIGDGSGPGELTEAEIRDRIDGYRSRFPDVVVLWSGQWSVYAEPYWYVVIVPRPASDPGSVLRWCGENGFGQGDCLAKLLLRNGTPEAATRVN